METDPQTWLTDTGAKAHAQSSIFDRGSAITARCSFVPTLAEAPYSGLVQALERCYVNGTLRAKGEVFRVQSLVLTPSDPYLPCGSPTRNQAPTLSTPFRRDFVESILAFVSENDPL
jgi:hypothetical protein